MWYYHQVYVHVHRSMYNRQTDWAEYDKSSVLTILALPAIPANINVYIVKV